MTYTVQFENDGRAFSGLHAAQAFMQNAGFSLGPLQRGSPIAAMFGEWAVAKWRNLSTAERSNSHAKLQAVHGSFRDGLVIATINGAAPVEAIEAFRAAQAAHLQKAGGQ